MLLLAPKDSVHSLQFPNDSLHSLQFLFTIFVVSVQAPTERFTTTQQEDEELARRFNLQFVCTREKELARQQRLETLGAIGVFDADMAELASTYGKIRQEAQAYLATLTPPSD